MCSPIFGVLHFCLHPFTQNDPIRHGNTYGEGHVFRWSAIIIIIIIIILWANTLPEALCRNMKIRPLKGRGLGHVTNFEIFGPPFISSERLKLETAYLVQHVLAIVWQITPKVGVVRSRDVIIQYNVNVGNKTAMFDLSPLHHVLNWQVFLHWSISHSRLMSAFDKQHIRHVSEKKTQIIIIIIITICVYYDMTVSHQ